MPRVKALTTGSVPSFVDLILNFAESDDTSTLATQDSWLAQLKSRSDRNLVMYGDDTWLRLFPDFFKRADGTTSFFVSDFKEVDNNVTRHVPEELARDDWSAMIMHYLGLDHIGHKTGPQSPYMAPKQTEMDGILRQIYQAMESQPHLQSSLLVLCGDHGMNEAGNHGGSASGETSTALVFVSPKFAKRFPGFSCPTGSNGDYEYFRTVEQSDIVPSLAALLGFPIPLNNLGVIIPEMLEFWKDYQKRIGILQANVVQILDIARRTFPSSSTTSPASLSECEGTETDVLLCEGEILAIATPPDSKDWDSELSKRLTWLRKAQAALSGTASNYDLKKMLLGLSLSSTALITASVMSYPLLRRSRIPGLAFGSVLLAYGVMHFASSYVEEEQQFWYWASSGWLCYLFTKQQRKRCNSRFPQSGIVVAIAILFRLTRRWNQTGQKFAGEPDIVKFLSQNVILLWFLITASYAVPSRRLCHAAATWFPSVDLSLLPVPITMVALLFKISFTAADAPELLTGMTLMNPLLETLKSIPLATQARAVFAGLAILLVLTLCAHTFNRPTKNPPSSPPPTLHSTLHSLLTLLLLTQSRPTNIPLFLLFTLQHSLLHHHHLPLPPTLTLPLTTLLLRQSSFFSLGASNAISSIDLSNAYNGVTAYNISVVGFLTLLSNWAGPVFWVSAAAELRAAASSPNGAKVKAVRAALSTTHFLLATLFAATSATAVMAACYALREHLFVWTVFSPKYLFAGAWVVGFHGVFEGVVGWGVLG
ncbi:MAG: hypothetical protein Q9160_000736 [Pyrenula sp. 1 TL-2023]